VELAEVYGHIGSTTWTPLTDAENEIVSYAYRINCLDGGTSFCGTGLGLYPMARQQLHDQHD
jgi:hypothetical protein